MTTADLWTLLAAGIATLVGFLIALAITERQERRRKAARLAAIKAEQDRYLASVAAFYEALFAWVERAIADFDTARDIEMWDAEVSG